MFSVRLFAWNVNNVILLFKVSFFCQDDRRRYSADSAEEAQIRVMLRDTNKSDIRMAVTTLPMNHL